MKKYLTGIISLLMVFSASMHASAHGDHTVLTPAHGLEHLVWYGAATLVAMLIFGIGRKLLKSKNNH